MTCLLFFQCGLPGFAVPLYESEQKDEASIRGGLAIHQVSIENRNSSMKRSYRFLHESRVIWLVTFRCDIIPTSAE